MPHLGAMKILVQIERRATTLDNVGGQSLTWNNIGQAFAEMVSLSGRELEAAQAVRAADTHTFKIRWFPGLSEKDRFVTLDPDGVLDYYNITNIVDFEQSHRYQFCTAESGLATG